MYSQLQQVLALVVLCHYIWLSLRSYPIVNMCVMALVYFDLVLKKPLHWDQVQQQLSKFQRAPSAVLQVPLELKNAYIQHVEHALRQLEQLYHEEKWPEFAALVHQLKGSAGSFGLEQISQFAHQFQISREQSGDEELRACAMLFLEQCKACKLK